MKYIIGIDEVGRGPLAGPVTVGVVVCEAELYKKLKRNKMSRGTLDIRHLDLPPSGKDSKKLSPEAREKYAKVLKSLVSRVSLDTENRVSKRLFDISEVHISNKIIDKIGISRAIKKAIAKCLKTIVPTGKPCGKFEILLDGGLHAPVEFKNQKTIIRGDEKEKIIAWASILAKVSRDALMRKAGKKYPQYGFEIHKGYGTARHISAIKKHGLSAIHRKTFCARI